MYQGLEDSVAKMGWSVGATNGTRTKNKENGSSNSYTMIAY